jgi:hypothetical protein
MLLIFNVTAKIGFFQESKFIKDFRFLPLLNRATNHRNNPAPYKQEIPHHSFP